MGRKITLILLFFVIPLSAPRSESVEQALSNQLLEILKVSPDEISPTDIVGIYEVLYGADVLYITEDGKYVFQGGDLVELATMTSASETTREKARSKILAIFDKKKFITFQAKKEQHVVTVITDIDCPYCRKFHDDIAEINDAGITVRYLMYPRAGKGSTSYKLAASVLCADNINISLTKAKQLKKIENRICKNPIDEHMLLVENIGISTTPTIILGTGRVIRGYRPYKDFIEDVRR